MKSDDGKGRSNAMQQIVSITYRALHLTLALLVATRSDCEVVTMLDVDGD